MKENLKVLQAFVDEMKSTSSLNIKKTIINAYGKNPFIKSALVYTFDPYKKYYVTSKTCKKRSDLCDMNLIHNDIFHLLNDLNDRVYTGHDAIAMVNSFILQHKEYEDLIFSIIDRNLEIRASESVINKIIPNLIPTFDVALANKFDPKRVDWNDVWLASRKLDGVRCLTIVDIQGNVKCYSCEFLYCIIFKNNQRSTINVNNRITPIEDIFTTDEIAEFDLQINSYGVIGE